jgi:hypothetical protein
VECELFLFFWGGGWREMEGGVSQLPMAGEGGGGLWSVNANVNVNVNAVALCEWVGCMFVFRLFLTGG